MKKTTSPAVLCLTLLGTLMLVRAACANIPLATRIGAPEIGLAAAGPGPDFAANKNLFRVEKEFKSSL